MKITFDAILDHVNNIARQQEISERVRILKARLLQLTSDLEAGRITKEEFGTEESQIMKDIDVLIKDMTSQGTSATTQSSTDLGGLAGLL